MTDSKPGEETEVKDDEEREEGWEGLSEEASAGSLSPSAELEAALQEASDAVEAQEARRRGGRGQSVDKVTIEALSNELQSLKGEYELRCAELEDLKDRHLRLQAEFENFRRRTLKEREEAHAFGHQNLVKDLLATVDNLDRAIEHTEQSGGGDLQSLLQGVELVRKELLGALSKHGVSQIETEGVFDPAVHEAMAQQVDESVPPNTILQVVQKGYRLRDRMLRPARVIVSGRSEDDGAGSRSESE
jgi:molecular chaperone GrpE